MITSSFFSPDMSWKLLTPLLFSPFTLLFSWSSSSLTTEGDSEFLSLFILEVLDRNSSTLTTLFLDLGLLELKKFQLTISNIQKEPWITDLVLVFSSSSSESAELPAEM